MRNLIGALGNISIYTGLVVMLIAGVIALRKYRNLSSSLLLAGGIITIVCYTMIILGIPKFSVDLDRIDESYVRMRAWLSVLMQASLGVGHLAIAAGVLGIVQGKTHNNHGQ